MRTPLLIGLAAVVLVALVGCTSAVSPTATIPPTAAAVTPPTTSAEATVAATIAATAPEIPTAIPATPAAAPDANPSAEAASITPASPAVLGARAPVTIDVAPRFRSGRLAEPRTLTLPAGFKANVFAASLTSPRFMASGPSGTIFVTGMTGGQIYALPDRNGDGVADEIQVWAEGLRQPHGLAFHEGYLYVGETNRVVRFRVGPDGARQGDSEPVVPELPSGWMANEGNRGSVWGRPVDVLVARDGALLVSDDDGGAIYRITYSAT